jgi:two-component system nitrate/nitrite response regulator NarL
LPHRTGQLRVVLADDDAGFLSALVEVLQSDGRFEVVGRTARGSEVADLVAQTRPDLVVLDVRMPDGGAQAVTAVLERLGSSTVPRICALSAQTSTATIAALVRAGATGFLAKGAVGADVADLLARCAAGEVVLAAPHAAAAIDQLLRSAHSPV